MDTLGCTPGNTSVAQGVKRYAQRVVDVERAWWMACQRASRGSGTSLARSGRDPHGLSRAAERHVPRTFGGADAVRPAHWPVAR